MNILKDLLILLGPFLKEIFIKNDELKGEILKPKFILKFTIVITFLVFGLAYIYNTLSESLFATHIRYRELSKDYLTLESLYTAELQKSRLLEEAKSVLEGKLVLSNADIEALKEEINKLNSLKLTCIDDTNKEQPKRGSINDRLKGISY